MNKDELKNTLLSLELCIDNDYLNKYVDLICDNLHTKRETKVTHSHHIIPVYYIKSQQGINDRKKIKSSVKENSYNETVNLSIKNHILAHCYLEKCSNEKYKGKNLFSVYMLTGKNKDLTVKLLYEYVDELNVIDDLIIMFSDNMFDEKHRKALSESAKHRKSKDGTNVSSSGYVGGVTGLKMIYDVEGKRHYINKQEVEDKLKLGWTLPTNKKKSSVVNNTTQKHTYIRRVSQEEVHNNLSKSHLGNVPANKGVAMTEKAKDKMRETVKGKRWMNNGVIQTQVMKDNIEEYLTKGFVFGQIKKGR